MLRKLVTWSFAGALAGVFTVSAFAPDIAAWFNTPGVGNALCDCATTTSRVASQVVSAQLIGAAVGAFVFLLIGIFWERWRKTKRAASAGSATSTPIPS